MATRTLASNLTITQPLTSASVNLAASQEYDAQFSLNLPDGTAIRFAVQASADNVTFTDAFIADLIGVNGVGKQGQDLSKPVVTCILSGGLGPRFRIVVLSVTGTVVLTSLVVSNTPL